MEWPAVAAVATGATFIWKLIVDGKLARYRETIGLIEKRQKPLDDLLAKIKELELLNDQAALNAEVGNMLSWLDTVALLVEKNAVDREVIYNLWWRFFVETAVMPSIVSFIENQQRSEPLAKEHYLRLSKEFTARCAAERSPLVARDQRWQGLRVDIQNSIKKFLRLRAMKG